MVFLPVWLNITHDFKNLNTIPKKQGILPMQFNTFD